MNTATLPRIMPTAAQIEATKAAINAYIQRIDANPDRREGAYPYYLFHQPDQPILGTVMMFHGFSAKPHQMWRLADYLFRNGFNLYQVTLAGHGYVRPAVNWPQVDLKPEIAEPLKAKVKADPVLSNYLNNLSHGSDGFTRPSHMQRLALMARLLKVEPRLLDIMQSIERSNNSDFDQYFDSSHLNYLLDARDRLAELDAMPGPIYTVGLSVGGATALGIASDRPDRIKKVVAYAPLLRVFGEDRRKYVNLAGPLDVQELGWDPNLRFPVGALTAADRFGSAYVLRQKDTLKAIPTFMVLTENEDAADIETNQNFFRDIGGERRGHRSYFYAADALVPHPLVDPEEVSQGMSNRFWRSLYQETFRFLATGEVDLQNMASVDPSPDLPTVPPIG